MASQQETPLNSLFKYKEPWIIGLGMAGAAGSQSAIGAFWPTFTGEEYNTAVTFAGLIIGLNFLASAPTQMGVTVFPFFARRTPMVLMACGIGLCASYLGMLFSGSKLVLIFLGLTAGMSFCFIPPMMAVLYGLKGIKPREVAVSVGLAWTLLWGGSALGPLIVGFVQEATGDLRLGLLITSMGPLALTALRHGDAGQERDRSRTQTRACAWLPPGSLGLDDRFHDRLADTEDGQQC